MFGAAGLIRSGNMLHLALGVHFKAEGCILVAFFAGGAAAILEESRRCANHVGTTTATTKA